MNNRRPRGNNNDSHRYFDWLDHAGEDLVCAQLLIQDDFTYNSAAFHCQQCMEKAFKAYLLFKQNRLVDGHNLTWLCKQVARENKDFEKWLPSTIMLNRAYIEARYPADIPLDLGYSVVNTFYLATKEVYTVICQEIDAAVAHKNTKNYDSKKKGK